jgi:hypothetical protein
MFLMSRLVVRSSRSLAIMLCAAASGAARARDYLRGRPLRWCAPLRCGLFLQYPEVLKPFPPE